MFETHHGVQADLSQPFPAVNLPQLGGPRAFVRWLILCRYFSRATSGVAEGMYVGASVETRVLNTMSAVGYWVTRHHGSEPWARVHLSNRHNSNQLRRLVKHLLPTFQGWVGDGEVFSKRLWWDYDQLRHDPAHTVDYAALYAFTIGARLMQRFPHCSTRWPDGQFPVSDSPRTTGRLGSASESYSLIKRDAPCLNHRAT